MARTTGSHSQTTGPRVRAQAEALFAKHGYAAVSMRQIAAAVGVQAGALYNYIPDKQSLLFSLLHDHMTDLLTAWGEQAAPSDPLTALDHFTQFHLEYHLNRKDAVFIAYMELRNLTSENFAAIETLRRQYEDKLEQLIIAAQQAGQVSVADTRIVTLALIGMLTEVTTWYRRDGRLDVAEICIIYKALVRRTLGATQI